MKITYYVHDINFPLREGIRKQAWWMALAMKSRGHNVEIVSTSKKSGFEIREGINIRFGSPLGISGVKTDVLHLLSHPSPLIVPLLLRAKAKKVFMTMFDGGLNAFWKRSWAGIVSGLVNRKVDIITLQTKYQAMLLRRTRISVPARIIPPIFPILKKKGLKHKRPTLLYMSHMHPNKGISEVLAAYRMLKKNIPSLRLIVANSRITVNHKILADVCTDPDVVLKDTVDPAEELSKAWVYLYPIRSAQETFSVPISLVEALQVGTPFVSTSVGAIPDFFDKNFLVRPNDAGELAKRIGKLMTVNTKSSEVKNPNRKPKNKIDVQNEKTISIFGQLY